MASSSKRRPGRRQVHESAVAYDGVDPKSRAERVVAVLGNNRVAEILGVSRSQPGRWRTGAERVSSEILPSLIDLDYAVSRMLAEWSVEGARLWLEGSEPHLNGARPIDVMIIEGPRAIMGALNAIEAGAL